VAVVGLGIAQGDATGDELRAADRADLGWPVTRAAEHLAFVAMALPPWPDAPVGDDEVTRLEATLHGLAARAEGRAEAPVPPPPPLPDLPRTGRAVDGLRAVLDEFGPALADVSGDGAAPRPIDRAPTHAWKCRRGGQ
jgi:hypothetical protein